MKFRRPFLLLLLLLGVVVGGVLLAGRLYLNSDAATRQVAARLEAAYGGTVQIEGTDIGVVGDSSLRGVRLYETGEVTSAPWAVAEEVRTDVSVWAVLRGVAPRRLTLTGAAVTLRFDEQGKLLTRIPESEGTGGPLPVIRVERSQLTLRQEGRPDMLIRGIDAEVRPEGELVVLTGRVTDPFWGDWSLNGSQGQGTISLTLKADRAEVTLEKLRQIAFVPPTIWDVVQPWGETPVEVVLRRDAGSEKIHYRVALSPDTATVHVPSIDLQAEQVRGRIVIEDGVVYLRDVRGRTLGGEITTTADLDFRGVADRLQFMVRAEKLDFERVPESWNLPPQLRKVRGKLSGSAEMAVTVREGGEVHTSGHGEGVITEAKIAGLPADPIRLRLVGDGASFHFNPAEGDPPPVPPSSAQGPNWTRLSTLLLTQLMAGGATVQVSQPDAKPNYLEINLGMKDVDLEQLVKGLELELPFRVAGRVTFKIHAAMPVNSPRDLKAYRFQGTVDLSRLILADLEMEEVRARVIYADGVLRLEELTGKVPAGPKTEAGRFNGTARMELLPRGDLTARLALERIPLDRILSLVPGAAEQTGGTFSGKAEVKAPVDQLRDVTAWQASGTIGSELLQAYGLRLTDASAALRLERGVLSAKDVRGRLEDSRVTGTAELNLIAPYRFQGKLGLVEGELAALTRLAPELRPPLTLAGRFDIEAEVKGTLSPLAFDVSGTGSADDAKVAGVSVGSLRFRWGSDADRLRLSDIKVSLYRGEVTGSAVIPWRAKEAGQVEAHFKDLDVAALAKDLPMIPFPLEGRVTGTVKGTMPEAKEAPKRTFTAKVDLAAPRLRVQGIEAERLQGTVEYQADGLEYRLVGQTLGGSFQVDGRIPPEKLRPAQPGPAKPEPEGRLRVRGVDLARLGPSFGTGSGPLRGSVDLWVNYRHEDSGLVPKGRGAFVITGLSWGDAEAVGDVRGDVVVDGKEMRLRDLSGSLAGGLFRGQVAIRLRDRDRSWFTLTLDGAEASRILAPWPELASRVEGPLELRLRGNLGREWRGEGTVSLARGKILGVEVTALRVPVGFALASEQSRGQVTITDASAQVARGRVTGRAELGLGVGTRMEGQVRFHDVDLATLLREISDSEQTAAGKLTGRIDFSGTEVRSINDVAAVVEASFSQTQALQLPVLRQLTPFLMPGRSGATFQTGELRGRLGGGIFRIQRLNLEGSLVRLFAEGTITLEGRLDLDVVANTGQLGANPNTLRLLGLRIPAVGPIPITLLLEARNYLSNRVLYLRVAGTVDNPVVRIDPIPLLAEEAVRYFLRRSNVPLTP